jgi:hypothetical protein
VSTDVFGLYSTFVIFSAADPEPHSVGSGHVFRIQIWTSAYADPDPEAGVRVFAYFGDFCGFDKSWGYILYSIYNTDKLALLAKIKRFV